MSVLFRDARLFCGGYDLSGDINALAVTYGADVVDATAMGDDTRKNVPAIKSVVAAAEGLWSGSAPDPVFFARVGTSEPVVIAPVGGDAGGLAYLFQAVHAEYSAGGAVGELLPYSVSLEGAEGTPLVRGRLVYNDEEELDVTGTAYQLGALSAAQTMYGVLHVFSGSGAFTAKVQSADDEAFTEANDRITFATVATGTAIYAEWSSVAGAVNDTWWRVVATNPATRNFAVAVGII